MRTAILLLLLTASIFSCSSKKSPTVDKEAIAKVLATDTMELPVFKDSIINNYVKEYNQFTKDYLSAIQEDDNKKIKELKSKSLNLTEQAKKVSTRLTTKATLQKYNRWMNIQKEKITIINHSK